MQESIPSVMKSKSEGKDLGKDYDSGGVTFASISYVPSTISSS